MALMLIKEQQDQQHQQQHLPKRQTLKPHLLMEQHMVLMLIRVPQDQQHQQQLLLK